MHSYKELGLSNTRAMYAGAIKGKYAIPGYNFNNMEQLQAIMTACIETKSPVILQVSSGARKSMATSTISPGWTVSVSGTTLGASIRSPLTKVNE